MNHPHPKTKLDELLAGAVDLRPQPDFAAWRRKHPEAIEALRAIPTVIAKRRSTMIRIVRYSTSAAAVVLFAHRRGVVDALRPRRGDVMGASD